MPQRRNVPDRPVRAWLRVTLAILALAVMGGAVLFAQVLPPEPPTGPVPGGSLPGAPAPGAPLIGAPPQDMVVDVRVTGNQKIPQSKVFALIQTRKNRAFDPETVERDVRILTRSRLFVSVRPSYQEVPGGRIVIFEVVERPTVQKILYVGNENIRKKVLENQTKIKEGDAMDPSRMEEARKAIEDFYHGRGYPKCRVTLLEGGKSTDTRVVFLVNEGRKQKVLWIDFVGNTFVDDARLRTQIKTAHPFLWLFKGEVDRKEIDEDVKRLTAYYRSFGYFDAKIGRVLKFDEKQKWLVLTFVIDEGQQYFVQNVQILGNSKIPTEKLAANLKLAGGQAFNQSKRDFDIRKIQDEYGSVGYVFADVKAETRFFDQPGKVDLVYTLKEGDRYTVGRINVAIKGDYPHTRLSAVLNRVTLRPGDIVDTRKIRDSERLLKASQMFLNNPMEGEVPKIAYHPPENEDKDTAIADRQKRRPNVRGQSPDPDVRELDIVIVIEGTPDSRTQAQPELLQNWTPEALRGVQVLSLEAYEQQRLRNAYNHQRQADLQRQRLLVDELRAGLAATPCATAVPAVQNASCATAVPAVQSVESGESVPATWPNTTRPARPWHTPESAATPVVAQRYPIVRYQYTPDTGGAPPTASWQTGPRYDRTPATAYQPVAAPPGNEVLPPGAPGVPPVPAGGNGVAPGQMPATEAPAGAMALPLFNPATGEHTRPLPIYIDTKEAPTGRLMLGVGVNSDLGLTGSVMLEELNFDWTRFPTSWEEVSNATAFRGAGQRFRIEAVPGTQVQRYMANFTEPYLLNTEISLGLSGFYYDRRLREWDEQRLGGRVALGYHLTPHLTGNVSFRGEKVNIRNPITPPGVVPQLDAVVGDNSLYGFGVQLSHDRRDSPFLATEGHLIELNFEQVIGTWQYPRFDVDVRKYFLLHERPDTSGRHVLSLNARFGVSGDNTPIYDHYYAGGFSTLRGFQFRGVSPVENGVMVGGQSQLLASAEYMFPITADDMLRAVVFCDTGTVNTTIKDWNSNYRVAPGFGFRVVIPAMGPAPIAFDFAFPVSSEPTDQREIFAFFLGVFR